MKTFFVISSILISFIANAQMKDVTIITATSETIIGKVDDKEWLNNPTVIKVKKNGSTSFTEYRPEDVKSIRIKDGDYYESYLVKIDITPTEFEGPVLDSAEIASTEKHAFLLVQLATPELSLYSYQARSQLRYYLKKGNEIPQELIHRKYTIKRSNGIFETEDNQYISQLEFLGQNCKEVDQKLQSLSYSLKDFIDLITAYYKTCKVTDITYRHTHPNKGKFSASILAGGIKTQLTFNIDNSDEVYFGATMKSQLSTKASFAPGIRVNYIVPRAHRKISLALELYYNNFKTSGFEYIYNNEPEDYQTKQVDIDAHYLHSTFGIIYSLNKEFRVRPYIFGGLVESFIVSHKSQVIYDKHYFAPSFITKQDPFVRGDLSKTSFGFFFGGGLTYNRIGFDLRYHLMGNLARFTSTPAPIHATTMFLSYRFTR